MTAPAYIAVSGGVGGAKLALGLAGVLPPEQLLIVANTGDDFDHLGLRICPDLDTVMYTLAGLACRERGWGLAGESWNGMDMLRRLGGEAWFQLGDRDLATHLQRSQRLRQGASLSEVTGELCRALGVQHPVVPMSDDEVATIVHTADGKLAFQQYFVREQCRPQVTGFHFEGVAAAQPSPRFASALASPHLKAVLVCPSNPYVSVGPILAVPGVREALAASTAPVVAVSPIVGGLALKGPAAKMMAELGVPASPLAVARHFLGAVDAWVIDEQDAAQAPAIEALGLAVEVAQTVMKSDEDKRALAQVVVDFADRLVG